MTNPRENAKNAARHCRVAAKWATALAAICEAEAAEAAEWASADLDAKDAYDAAKTDARTIRTARAAWNDAVRHWERAAAQHEENRKADRDSVGWVQDVIVNQRTSHVVDTSAAGAANAAACSAARLMSTALTGGLAQHDVTAEQASIATQAAKDASITAFTK